RASHAQLFRIYFNVISFDTSDVDQISAAAHAPAGEPSEPVPTRSIFDLTLYVFEQRDSFVLDAVYRTDLYDAATIASLLRHLRSTLEAAALEPDRRLSRFVLSAGEPARAVPPALQAIRHGEFPAEAIEQAIGQRFDEQVSRHARRLAVRTRRHEWTYAELQRHARRVAIELRRRSVSPGQRVALLCRHDAPMVAGILGVLMAGGVYVPLDPSFPRERHREMLADADATCIVTDAANVDVAARLDRLTINIEEQRSPEDASVPGAPEADALAYILYTSGSSGRPKGVAQSHRNVLHHCRTYTNALRLHSRDRVALIASSGFDAAVMDIFGALLNGATLCPVDVRAESPESLAERIHAEGVTVLHSTPTVYRYLLRNNPGRPLPDVRAVVLGGEEVVRGDVDLYHAHFSPKCVLVNGLGPTESTLALQYFMDHRTPVARTTVPVGYPVAGTDVLLIDESGEPIPGCGTGELAFRSRHVARGYWGQPELTERAFSPDGDDPTMVTYRSGDLAHRLPDGRIEFLGRKDQQVKIRGVRIELAEVESRLLEHEAVREAVVGVFEPEPGDKRLVAYIVSTRGQMPTLPELSAFLRLRLPESMVPGAFVPMESLPLAPNGKVNREALPVPDSVGRLEPLTTFVAPSTPTERALASIWTTLLRVPEVGAADNFFELGGHSLLATQLASRVRSALQVDMPLRQYFATPTLRALAGLIDRASQAVGGGVQTPAITRAPRELYRVRVSPAGEFVLPTALKIDSVKDEPGFGSSSTVRQPGRRDESNPNERPESRIASLYAVSAPVGVSSVADV
ncbi:MAG: non-ribosomal peptide synthetase, partial [Vicinamibacterales bacterium]